jgi:hypothetical protein
MVDSNMKPIVSIDKSSDNSPKQSTAGLGQSLMMETKLTDHSFRSLEG